VKSVHYMHVAIMPSLSLHVDGGLILCDFGPVLAVGVLDFLLEQTGSVSPNPV